MRKDAKPPRYPNMVRREAMREDEDRNEDEDEEGD